MPEVTRYGRAVWPGVVGPVHCSYTTSHGITPGVAVLSINPQPPVFPDEADLLLDDGVTKVLLRSCKVRALKRSGDVEGGWVDTLEILDRRWKWTLGAISGSFNQLDDNKKLIPWTIRSPAELAKMLLDAMGEVGYEIDMPPGFNSDVAALATRLNPPWMGVTPMTGTNPPVNWEAEVPAVALANLCELFGRRVIWRWKTDSVLITVPGIGANLPPGSVATSSPSIRSAMKPAGVGVIGAPTRYQGKWLLEPVGEEWHGALVPINELSYAPLLPARVQIVNVYGRENSDGNLGITYQVSLNYAGSDPSGIDASYFTYNPVGGDTMLDVVTDLAAQINADPNWGGWVTAATRDGSADDWWMTITSKDAEQDPRTRDFTFATTSVLVTDGIWRASIAQAGASERPGWELCMPPQGYWNSVREVPGSLTKLEAVRLAQKTVWRCFRVVANPDGTTPLAVPGYGYVARRQQLLLEDSKVELINPPTDFLNEFVSVYRMGEIAFNFYNGYSHCRPMAVYGTVALAGTGGDLLWGGSSMDFTDPSQPLLFDFTVDPTQQTVTCSRYLFNLTADGKVADPRLVLETAVQVRDANSNAISRFVMEKPFPDPRRLLDILRSGGRDHTGVTTGFYRPSPRTNYAYTERNDVQVGVIGHYTGAEAVVKVVDISSNVASPTAGVRYRVGLGVQGTDPLDAPLFAPATNSMEWEYTAGGGDGWDDVANSIAGQINADAVWSERVVAFSNDGTVSGKWLAIVGSATSPDNVLFYEADAKADDSHTVNWTPVTRVEPVKAGAGIKLVASTILELDPLMRASYYLAGLEAQYLTVEGHTVKYNGFEPVDLDGAIQQVTWNCDVNGGCDTEASRNCEHHPYVPPYPARRRLEGMVGRWRRTGGNSGPGLFNPYTADWPSNPYTAEFNPYTA